ncbi:DUF1566 domain-containing protein [Desulfopila sp. IMCC35008]|uniref:Lcl domain-containing protein n=1 Tax=Desulfopila sp. IMCC35008 TaxID=2653858 RepID=UPI0013D346DA|nr:DUF1566 domain-containing protein [Desulfopila sp. IMCC35008]
MTLPYSRRQLVLLPLLIFCFLLLVPLTAALAEARFKMQSDSVFLDTKTGAMWQLERSRKIRSVEQAYAFLNSLNEGQYDDWRMPTDKELAELFLLFDLRQNGDVEIKLDGSYWHHQENGDISAGSWELGDECGPSRVFFPAKYGYLRAIRP